MSAGVAQATARAIRRDILAIGRAGQPLGSEDDLMARYGVSRPTLRQAVRIVEHDQLLTVRRGVGGGYSTRLPTGEAVAQAASAFLQLNGTGPRELLRAASVLTPAIAGLACTASDDRRHAYCTWVASRHDLVVAMRRRHFLEHICDASLRLAVLTDCAPLALFQSVLNRLTLDDDTGDVHTDDARRLTTAAYHLDLAAAVRDADARKATYLANGNLERVDAWLADSADRPDRDTIVG